LNPDHQSVASKVHPGNQRPRSCHEPLPTFDPRTLIGLAAFAFSALTIVATVMLPAKMGSANADAHIVASARAPAALTAIAPDSRMRLEIVGVRDPDVSAVESKGPKAARYWHG
jgi:hypothetical protein